MRTRYQFTVFQLLVLTAIVSITLVLLSKAPFLAMTLCAASLFWVFGFGRSKQGRLLLVLFAVLIPMEFACGLLAYHTLSEIDSSLVRLLLLLNVVFLALFIHGSRRTAFCGTLLLATWIVPHQCVLGFRWWLVHQEAAEIVAYAEQVEDETGDYPRDLSGYTYRHTSIKPFVHYSYNRVPDTFSVNYYVGTPGTSHWYDGGLWKYHPD